MDFQRCNKVSGSDFVEKIIAYRERKVGKGRRLWKKEWEKLKNVEKCVDKSGLVWYSI